MADESDPLVLMYLRRIEANVELAKNDVAELKACMDRVIIRLENMGQDRLKGLHA